MLIPSVAQFHELKQSLDLPGVARWSQVMNPPTEGRTITLRQQLDPDAGREGPGRSGILPVLEPNDLAQGCLRHVVKGPGIARMVGQAEERKYHIGRRCIGQVRFAFSARLNANGSKFVHEVAHHLVLASQDTDALAWDLLV